MESIRIERLTFTYPGQTAAALRDVSLTVRQGDFFVLCGPSGCGKSTLLRQLKPALAPHGERSGEILFEGAPLSALTDTEAAAAIGFVQQSPDAQLVTDKVWHELAFGMECLGIDPPAIRRRTAEMAAFFGMESWFYQDVAALSGGQKQLLCLAAVMTMQPRLLILDEPTAQLDPIAASEFLGMLQKINRELGVTVLLSEHRLEEALPMASAAALLDGGSLLTAGTPRQLGLWLREHHSGMFAAMPTAMRIWGSVDSPAPCPVTPVEGRLFLEEYAAEHPLRPLHRAPRRAADDPVRLQAKEVWFRYEKDGPDVLKGLDLTVRGGELLCILGGNGAGKTTALRLLAGLRRPYRGSIARSGRVVLLPQDPQTLFIKKTVGEDLADAARENGLPAERAQAEIAEKAALCGVTHLLERHPYDLSGGEQQRAALAKLLLLHPDVLLLDEPTKGLDVPFKAALAALLRRLCQNGAAVVLVSHDIEFSACYADRCALFFDGALVTEGAPEDFFARNSFYTTAAGRIARRTVPEAVTCADVIAAIGGRAEREDAAAFPFSEETPPAQWEAAPLTVENVLPPPEEAILPPDAPSPNAGNDLPPQEETVLPSKKTAALQKSAALPKGRRIAAALTGAAAAGLLVYILTHQSLRGLLTGNVYTAAGGRRLLLYAAFALLLIVLAVLVGQRSAPGHSLTEQQRRRVDRRTRLSVVLLVLLIPLTLYVGVVLLEKKQYYITALAVLLESMLPFFLLFEGRKPRPRELVTVAALCALGVAGRVVFFMLPQFKPVIALVIVAGVAFGGETGFLVGAVTMLVSNMLFSQGPWTPWQMFAMGLIGFLAGALYRKGMLRRSRASLAVFGAVCAVVIYGGILNPGSALMWASETLNVRILLSYYLTGLPMDCVQAAATAVFLWLGAEPMLEKLERIKLKYGMTE